MDRRTFLQATAALAVAASVPVMASVATQATVAVDPAQKYREALRLFDRCVAVASESKEVSLRLNTLLTYLRENFPVPTHDTETILAVRSMLKGPVDISGIRGIPPNVADEIYPIALLKLGLTSYRMDLNPAYIKEFDWFHDTYSQLIIKSADATIKNAV